MDGEVSQRLDGTSLSRPEVICLWIPIAGGREEACCRYGVQGTAGASVASLKDVDLTGWRHWMATGFWRLDWTNRPWSDILKREVVQKGWDGGVGRTNISTENTTNITGIKKHWKRDMNQHKLQQEK